MDVEMNVAKKLLNISEKEQELKTTAIDKVEKLEKVDA